MENTYLRTKGLLWVYLFWTLCAVVFAQTTYAPSEINTCTYSFVVPEPELVSTCKAYAQKQVSALQQKVTDLQVKVNTLSGGDATINNTARLNNIQFKCGCNNSTVVGFTYRDCQDVKILSGTRPSGVYEIEPIKSTGQLIHVQQLNPSESPSGGQVNQRFWEITTWGAIQVPCDLKDNVGWTILMRRSQMDVSFDRDWYAYKTGFGTAKSGDFWLGLENIYRITNQIIVKYKLWVVVTDQNKVPHVYPYGQFYLDNEAKQYTIHVEDYEGKMSNLMMTNRPFVTKDKQDPSTSTNNVNCAKQTKNGIGPGGWWFKTTSYYSHYSYAGCGNINLNAPRPLWYGITNVTSVEMKIRPS